MKRVLLFIVMTVFSYTMVNAQKTISGRVLDKDGKPISKASITVKGSNVGIAASEDGGFKLSVKTGDVLVVTAVGYGTKQVKVSNQSSISIELENASSDIGEVVVTAFGIKRQPKELGYATTTIKAEELTQAHSTNVVNGLTGKVAGLQIQTTNNGVNPDVRINLRGNRSITGNNQALVVVDGAIVPTSYISSLNPDDIESTTIIKGSEGAVLYGSDGSNGVLVITTKKGDSKGSIKVKLSSNVQFENVSIMPNLQSDYGSSAGENGVDPITGVFNYVPYENQSFGPRFDGSIVDLGTKKRFYNSDGSFYDTTLRVPYTGLKNAKRDFWNTGLTTQNNISISSGDKNNSVFLGFQNVFTKGIVPNDEARRNSFRVNATKDFQGLKIDVSASYSQITTDVVGPSYFQDRPLYFAILNTPAHVDLKWFENIEDKNSFGYHNNYYNSYYPNPWWQIKNSRVNNKNDYWIGNVNLSYKFNEWFDASYRLSYSSSANYFRAKSKSVIYSDYEATDPFGTGNIASQQKITLPSVSFGNINGSRKTGDLFLNFHKKIKDFSGKLILGHSFQSDLLIGETTSGNTNFDDNSNINTRIGYPKSNEYLFERNIQGAFSDATIGFRDYIFAHFSFRKSWNSVLPESNRSFSYGGGDLSTILSDAFPEFFKGDVLSYLKVRASYGVTGNVNLDNITPFGAYNTKNYFNPGNGFPFNNQSGFLKSSAFKNDNIKDERTTEIEIGAEVGLLKNRINLTGSLYKTRTKNQTLTAQTSWASGYGNKLINIGETQNIGVESDLKITILKGSKDKFKGLKWDVGVNFNYIFNRVNSLPDGLEVSLGNTSYAIVGKAFPSIKVYDWNRDPLTGKVIVDANGDPSRASSTINVGSAFNPYRLGFNSTVSFKGFTLTGVIDYRSGGLIFNRVGQDMDFTGVSEHSTYGGRKRFVFPNSVYKQNGKYVENNDRTISNVYNFWTTNINTVGTPYVTSAAFWKLREVALTYNVPNKYLSFTKYVKNVSVGVFGRNLLTFRPKENIWTDPEFNNNSTNAYGASFNDAGYTTADQTPPTRFWGFNLNVNF